MKTLLDAKGPRAIEGFADLAKQVKDLGSLLAGTALVLPSRIVPIASGAPVMAPTAAVDSVVASIGKGTNGPFLTIDFSRPALELALRFAMGSMMGGGGGGGGGGPLGGPGGLGGGLGGAPRKSPFGPGPGGL